MTGQFEDKPTNGYNKDKRLIEYRLDEIDERLKKIEDSNNRQEVAFAELKTEFRVRVGIMGAAFGLVGGFLVWLVQWGLSK